MRYVDELARPKNLLFLVFSFEKLENFKRQEVLI